MIVVAVMALDVAAAMAAAVPCDTRPATMQATNIWVLPTGRDLAFGDPSSGLPVPGTRRGDQLTVGVVYRNCHPNSTQVHYYRDLYIGLAGLGSAFRFLTVVEDGGLGAPTVRRGRVSWGDRLLVVAPGTQVNLTVRVRAHRPGRFEFGGHFAFASRPTARLKPLVPSCSSGACMRCRLAGDPDWELVAA